MKITENTTIMLNYVLMTSDGAVLETTKEHGPITILYGHEMFPAAAEKALEGKSAGESVRIELNAEDAFGERLEELVTTIPVSEFDSPEDLEIGSDIIVDDGENEMIMTVNAVEDGRVTLDGNHPFAGHDIIFEFSITDVRQTTQEDIDLFYDDDDDDDDDHEHGHHHDDDCNGCCGGCC